MEDKSNILKQEVNQIKEDLIAKHLELGMKASGDWINSLKTDVTGLSAVIYANPYTEQLANGREPGKFPPISAIKKWIEDKNITPFDNISISSLAFLIARKIAKEGTKYFKQGGTDLVTAVITPKRVQYIIDRVSEFYINDFLSEVTGVFNELKAA